MCLPKILLYSRPTEGTFLEESSSKEIGILSCDSEAVKNLVKESNRFCYGSKLVEKLDGWSEEEIRTAFGRIEPRPPISGRL